MNNNHDSKFSLGLILGLIIGGGAVFLLGTKTGKNFLKILSEQGLDGLLNVLEEYGLEDEEEYEQDGGQEEYKSNGHVKQEKVEKEEVKEQAPRKRFFKRIRR